MLLHIAPDVFRRVQLRRIGGQVFHGDFLVGSCQIVRDDFAAMLRQSIPDNEKPAADFPAECFQEFDQLRFLYRASDKPEIEVAKAKRRNHCQLAPVEAVAQHWRSAFRRPGPNPRGPLTQPGFVNEENDSSLAARFFLRIGQRLYFHCCIACSLRPVARPVGLWQEKPNALRMSQTLLLP